MRAAELADVLGEHVVGNDGGNGGEESCRGGDQRLGDSRSNCPQGCSTCSRQGREKRR